MRLRFVFLLILGFSASSVHAISIRPLLINGTPVPVTKYKEVIRIAVGESGACTGSIVGPRVILTAGHCGETGSVGKFVFGGKRYETTFTQSPGYEVEEPDEDDFSRFFKEPKTPHDLALGLVEDAVEGAHPLSIGGTLKRNATLDLFGYGCTGRDRTGGNDGILRSGSTLVHSIEANRLMTTNPLGAILCPGDSGGPAFNTANPPQIVAVNSAVGEAESLLTGERATVSLFTRLDVKQSRDFMKDFAAKNKVDICGVTKVCR